MIAKHSYVDTTDEALLQQVKAGARAAFDELYNRYAQKLFSYFFRMLWKDKALAEDFTQDLFVKIIHHHTTFDETKNFSTWLYSIANNMCKNEYRKKEVRSKHAVAVAPASAADAVNPDMKKFREAVHQCSAGLPEEKKTLYILRFQENLSVPDISKVLGIPEGTVKSRIFYLLKEMKEKLKPFETLSVYP